MYLAPVFFCLAVWVTINALAQELSFKKLQIYTILKKESISDTLFLVYKYFEGRRR